MVSGAVLDRGGNPYKPSTRRSYEQALRGYVVPRLGHLRLSDVRRRDVQAFVDDLRARGLSPSTVANKLNPLQVNFRRAAPSPATSSRSTRPSTSSSLPCDGGGTGSKARSSPPP